MPLPHGPSHPAARREARETWPLLAFVGVVIVFGYVEALRADDTLRAPVRLVPFTLLMVSSLALYWTVPVLLGSRRALVGFCLLQGAVTFAIGLMAPQAWLVLSLYSALVGMSVGAFWPDRRLALTAATLCIGQMSATLVLTRGLEAFLDMLPLIGLTSVFVCTFVILFVRQFQARQKAQELLRSLQEANRQLQAYAAKVEELTLGRERQRMGRELHDTLAQGLAGLTLQIEAVEGHLENANTARARALIQQAKQRARTTLREARRAIHALRPEILERGDLRAALGREADQFASSHGIPCELEASVGSVDPPPETAQDVLRFVQEGLSNVARHAQATRATVRIEQGDAELRVTVEDDGIGFEPGEQPGSLGMTGMRERAARLGGELSVQSSIGGGTRVALVVRQAGP